MADEKLYYSTKEAAQYLKRSVATVKYHVYQSKHLKAINITGQALMFTKEDLDRFLADPPKPGPKPAE